MFTKTLIISSLAALSAAQSAVLSFTHVPNPITDGQAQAITYVTNDTTTPVTILLRKGLTTDLKTVSTLTSSASGGQFVWTPSTSLANGADYALEITQGDQYNYFGPFQVQGAVASDVSSTSASSVASPSAYISSIVSANGTASTTSLTPVAPGTGATASGTGMPISRNATMSIATLTASTTGSPATNSASATGSSSASASPATSTNGASAFEMATTFSLLFGAAAAALCLQ
ncbi:hypothetical protein LTR08_000486 [Meristemomyces frigidus]|nr:hypothetical protein LTR08_000486 [Meristemomyces frigidus]